MIVSKFGRLGLKLCIGITLALSASGCAFNKPGGPVYSDPRPPAAGQSQLVVYRPLGEGGGYDRVHGFSVDGARSADMLHGGYSVIEVSPGTYELGTDMLFSIRAWIPCVILIVAPFVIYAELFVDYDTALSIDIGPDETKFIRFSPPHLTLEAVSSSDAKLELQGCRGQD